MFGRPQDADVKFKTVQKFFLRTGTLFGTDKMATNPEKLVEVLERNTSTVEKGLQAFLITANTIIICSCRCCQAFDLACQ